MLTTRFTQLVGCEVPIQCAGMGAAAAPDLTAAVSEAGALGMLGTGRPGLSSSTLAVLLDETRSRTARPFGVNFLVNPGHDTERRCFELAAEAARLVEFFYGWPDPGLVALVRERGALACWQVGSREEAIAAAAAGCDLVVAQGFEAGGHVCGRIGLQALLGEVIDAIRIPIIAAGGIGDGRAMAAALAAGADGVRVGTRFLAAHEANAHPAYVEALIAARAEDTVYSEAFCVGWPDAPHRILRSCLAAADALDGPVIGERDSLDGTRVPAMRFAPVVADRSTTGVIQAMSLWAGEAVNTVRRVQSAREIVDELAHDAEASLAGCRAR